MRSARPHQEEAERPLLTAHYAPRTRHPARDLRRFDRIYRERKAAAGALDFADLEEFTVRPAGRPARNARARFAAQFDQILMDEFQDTNGQQARLLELVRRTGRFYAVGDINQSIFGFRHAEPEVFRKYRDEVTAGGGRLVGAGRELPQPRRDSARRRDHRGRGRGIEPQRRLTAGRDFPDPRRRAPSR